MLKKEVLGKIFFKRWAIPARIGLLPYEKEKPQTLWIDLEWTVNMRKAATEDNLAYTIDYVQVKDAITDVVNRRHYDLLESLASAILDRLWEPFGLEWVRLAISKPEVFVDMEAVGVVLERAC